MLHDFPEQRANLSTVAGSAWLEEDKEEAKEAGAAEVEEEERVDENEGVSDPTVAPLLLVEDKEPEKDDEEEEEDEEEDEDEDEEEDEEEELVILHRAFTYWSPAATPLHGVAASGTDGNAECGSPVFEFSSPT